MQVETPVELSLSERWRALRDSEPGIRIREAAERLGVSEGDLLLTRVGDGVTVLRPGDWTELLWDAGKLGRVMGLTRNPHVVIEKHGHYQNVEGSERGGMVLDEGIDLRVFYHCWHAAFAVETPSKRGTLRSLQFFDSHGTAIHKIYVFPDGEVARFNALVAERSADVEVEFEPGSASNGEEQSRADADIDVAELRAQWDALETTHDFYPMLRRLKLGRLQAMRLAGSEYAQQVRVDGHEKMIEAMAAEALPFMAFVGNPGCIQIHSGIAKKVKVMDEWFNIFDPDFNLHLRRDAIASCWAVRKPTREHGDIWSVEAYDSIGRNVLTLFGLRKRSDPNSPRHRARFQELAEGL